MKRQANHHAFSIEETLPKRLNRSFKMRNYSCFSEQKTNFIKKA
ncbi:hypothetical protein BAME_32580 [Bacillus sp. M 2-6]|nr:hypothetical protein BAME_32580 [Bacillus sp. M 2-6]KIL26741.1 hypothetical protein B4133_3908 [Bacillus altitudinis]